MAPVVPLATPIATDGFPKVDPKRPSVELNGKKKEVDSHAIELVSQEHLPNGTSHNQSHLKLNGQNNVTEEEGIFLQTEGPRSDSGDVIREANGQRRVRWIDSFGNELAEIWEFEPSDTSDSDDDEDDDSNPCACTIMVVRRDILFATEEKAFWTLREQDLWTY